MAVRSLKFVLTGEDRASKTFQQAGKNADGLGKKLGGLGGAAKAGIAGALGGSLVVGGKAVFDMAAKMQLLDAKAKTVFGDSVGTVQKWAKANANAMGLTGKEAVGLSAGFADLLVPMGFTQGQAAKMATETVGLSGALAQWSGGTKSAAEVTDILSKAMLGETDGLKSLGIAISAADVDAQLAAKGQTKLKGAALEQAKAQAVQTLIFAKSKDAQAAYAKGADTLAGKQVKATAQLKEFRDKGIAAVVPKLVELIAVGGRFTAFLERNRDVVVPLVAVLGGFAAGVWAINKAAKAYTAVQAALNVVMSLNPIGLVVIGIAALVAGLVLAYKKSETFRNVIQGVFRAVGGVVLNGVSAMLKALGGLFSVLGKLPDAFGGGTFRGVAASIDGMVGKLSNMQYAVENFGKAAPQAIAVPGRAPLAADRGSRRGGEPDISTTVNLDGRTLLVQTEKRKAAAVTNGRRVVRPA